MDGAKATWPIPRGPLARVPGEASVGSRLRAILGVFSGLPPHPRPGTQASFSPLSSLGLLGGQLPGQPLPANDPEGDRDSVCPRGAWPQKGRGDGPAVTGLSRITACGQQQDQDPMDGSKGEFRGRGAAWGWPGSPGCLEAHAQSTSSLFHELVGDALSEWVSRQGEPHMSLESEDLKQEWPSGAFVLDPCSSGSRDPVKERVPPATLFRKSLPSLARAHSGRVLGAPHGVWPRAWDTVFVLELQGRLCHRQCKHALGLGFAQPHVSTSETFADKGPSSQSHGFSRSHVRM